MADTKQGERSALKRKEDSQRPTDEQRGKLEDLLKDGDYLLRKGLIPSFKKDKKT